LGHDKHSIGELPLITYISREFSRDNEHCVKLVG